MKREWLAVLIASIPLLGRAGAGSAADGPVARSEPASFRGRFLKDRLSIGFRVSRFWLEESRRYVDGRLDNGNRRSNFLGSLWGLDPQQGLLPAPFLEYRVISSAGVGAAYDETRIRTLDWADNDAQAVTAGDGDLRLRGARVYAFGAVPNRTRVTPLARVGFARYSSAFFETGGWAEPGRFFLVEDTKGWFVDVTLRVSLRRHLHAEASYEHLWLKDVAARAGGAVGAFPVRSDVVRVGIAYGF